METYLHSPHAFYAMVLD